MPNSTKHESPLVVMLFELWKRMMATALNGVDLVPKRQQPSPEKQAVVGAALKAVIRELDRTNRSY
jgi:hypothetical protein